MKNSILVRLATIVCCAAFIMITSASHISGQTPKVTLQPVIFMATGTTVPSSGSTLSRVNRAVFFTLHTQGLPPGNVVTAWLAVFNNPEYCATDPCTPADFANPLVDGTLLNTGGQVIGPDGAATYGAYREVGDVTGARPATGTGNGLVSPKGAQIHIVLRSHGPAMLGDPTALALQLTTFNGGCPPNTCVNLQASVHH